MLEKDNKIVEFDRIIELMDESVYDVKDTGETARNIHHWKKEGLLLNNEDFTADKKNKKLLFNLTEYFWIKTIQQLRKFGLPIKSIMKVKSDLENYVGTHFTDEIFIDIEKGLVKEFKKEYPNESDDYRRAGVEFAIKALREQKKVEGFEFIIQTLIATKKEVGLILLLMDDEIETHVYINYEGITNSSPELLMRMTHFYISFIDIFDELGLSNHLKHPEILSQEQRDRIKTHSDFVSSKKVKSVHTTNSKDCTETRVELRHIDDPKIIEGYKLKYGKDFTYRNGEHQGKGHKSDFRIDQKRKKP